MNNKGFAISGIMYATLVIFLILLLGILGTLGSRKVILDKTKKDILNKLNNYSLKSYDFSYTGNVQEFVAPETGTYVIELWGASGGEFNGFSKAGHGAYTSGKLLLDKDSIIYLYIGGEGESKDNLTNNGGYNGGGYSGNYSGTYSSGGGGATDVRTVNGLWNSFDSLKSRIMVAAGGAGSVNKSSFEGGSAGGLGGFDGSGVWKTSWTKNGVTYTNVVPTILGATQIKGGDNNYMNDNRNGSFGYALQSNISGWGGGGGGGYYAGATGFGTGGSGGSSFISGYTGCNSISEASTSSAITHTGSPNHYSGYVFSDSVMVDGESEVIEPDGTKNTGHIGDGYARITKVD